MSRIVIYLGRRKAMKVLWMHQPGRKKTRSRRIA
jgi:hypothetical protein